MKDSEPAKKNYVLCIKKRAKAKKKDEQAHYIIVGENALT